MMPKAKLTHPVATQKLTNYHYVLPARVHAVCQLKRTHTQHISEEIHSFKLMYCTRKLQGLNNIERNDYPSLSGFYVTLGDSHVYPFVIKHGGWVSALQPLLDWGCYG